MKHDDFDRLMRSFELSNDERIRPESYVIVRIDGHSFSTLTRKILNIRPFDTNLRNCMLNTVEYIMTESEWNMIYGYTQSDEISILLDHRTVRSIFGGKVRKLNSLLAALATAIFNVEFQAAFGNDGGNVLPIFDCRVIQIPTLERVLDYFNWRKSDSETNCLNQWAWYLLVNQDKLSPTQAQHQLNKKRPEFKHDILFQHEMNFDKLPAWQKRGTGYVWEKYTHEGFNPITKETVIKDKYRLKLNEYLPVSPTDHGNYIKHIIEEHEKRYVVNKKC